MIDQVDSSWVIAGVTGVIGYGLSYFIKDKDKELEHLKKDIDGLGSKVTDLDKKVHTIKETTVKESIFEKRISDINQSFSQLLKADLKDFEIKLEKKIDDLIEKVGNKQ
jgi:uncharacterized membrane-anchored protein YjiN (DUF445 family)